MTGSNATEFVQIMLERTRYSEELAKTLFEKLFSDLPQQVTAIGNALENRQFQGAIDTTHKLHGSASFCGLEEIRKPAWKLETCLRKRDLAPVENHFDDLGRQVRLFLANEEEIMQILATRIRNPKSDQPQER